MVNPSTLAPSRWKDENESMRKRNVFKGSKTVPLSTRTLNFYLEWDSVAAVER